jgi:hypothetical protein
MAASTVDSADPFHLGEFVFHHNQELQFHSTPEKPDAVYVRKLQEVKAPFRTS